MKNIKMIMSIILLVLGMTLTGCSSNQLTEEQISELNSYLDRKEEAMNETIMEDVYVAEYTGNYPPIIKYELWYNKEDNEVMICENLTNYMNMGDDNYQYEQEAVEVKNEMTDEGCKDMINGLKEEIKSECDLNLDNINMYFYTADGEELIQKYSHSTGWEY